MKRGVISIHPWTFVWVFGFGDGSCVFRSQGVKCYWRRQRRPNPLWIPVANIADKAKNCESSLLVAGRGWLQAMLPTLPHVFAEMFAGLDPKAKKRLRGLGWR